MEQPIDETEEDRYLALSIAVVQQALEDIARPDRLARRRIDTKYRSVLAAAKHEAQEARAFLLDELWREENPFGQVLSAHGARRIIPAHLLHCVRSTGEGSHHA